MDMSLLWRLQVSLGPAQRMVVEQDSAGALGTPSAFHPSPAHPRSSPVLLSAQLWQHHPGNSFVEQIPPLWFAAWRALSAQPSVSMRHPNPSTFGSRAPRPQERQLSIKNCFHVFLYPVTDKSTEVFSTAVTRREKCSEQQSNRSAFTVNWAWKISASLMCWSHTNLHTTGGRDEAMAREFGENFIFHWGQQVFLTCNGNQLAKEQVPWN